MKAHKLKTKILFTHSKTVQNIIFYLEAFYVYNTEKSIDQYMLIK